MRPEKQALERDTLESMALECAFLTITFSADGNVINANEKFLDVFGYSLEELIGQEQWLLTRGAQRARQISVSEVLDKNIPQTVSAFFITKAGAEVWLQVQYFPFPGPGEPIVVVVAANLSEHTPMPLDYRGQINAINSSLAVVHFSLDGIILDANELFLDTMGFTFDEVEGHHHRIFLDPAHVHSAEYVSFWRDLRMGIHHSGQYRRVGKNGREVWLQATYNPVFDVSGNLVKIIKYATVVTEQRRQLADHQGQIAAIHKAHCVISFDLNGIILDANENFMKATGYRLVDLLGQHHKMFVDKSTSDSDDYTSFWSDLAGGQHKSGEYRRLHKEGREIWLRATYNPIFDASGKPFKIVNYATDVTQEKQCQSDYRGQIDAINKSQGVLTLALDGTILDVNDNFLSMLGYNVDEIKGRHHSILVEPDTARSKEYETFWHTLRSGRFHSGIFKRVGKNGRELWINASYNPIMDLSNRPIKVIKFATDITSHIALAEAFEDAKRQAHHDAATSLPNRVKLANFMSACLTDPAIKLTVLYIDLDRFKPINDTYGHHVGDRVLGEVADRLRRALTPQQMVARVGGDEFVIAAPNLSAEEATRFAQNILDIVDAPIHVDAGEINVGLSMGIAISPVDGITPDELLRSADAALYLSKKRGKSTYSFFGAELNDRMIAERQFAQDLRIALHSEQFFLEYQPRFDTRAREVRSAESLIRWQHPTRGRVAPAEFIPIAERNGLIVPLGEWILNKACATAATWRDIGVSVNVSPVQFRNSDLVRTVQRALETSGLDAQRLELEITEGAIFENPLLAGSIMRDLKQLGVRLAMDDFGTGYSSLRYLRDFPFDVIKIDRSFVADLETSVEARSIVQAIIALGKALGISVTAEGVESNAQLAILSMDQCVEVQGFLLASPLSAYKMAEMIQKITLLKMPLSPEAASACVNLDVSDYPASTS